MATPQKSLEVLVVDDEESIRNLLSTIITRLGDNPTKAIDGQDGIDKYVTALANNKPFDVVITDLKMPNKSGVDVIKEVKVLTPYIPVYVITGKEATAEYAWLVAQLGDLTPDGVLQKPFSPDTIKNLLEPIRQRKYENPPSQS